MNKVFRSEVTPTKRFLESFRSTASQLGSVRRSGFWRRNGPKAGSGDTDQDGFGWGPHQAHFTQSMRHRLHHPVHLTPSLFFKKGSLGGRPSLHKKILDYKLWVNNPRTGHTSIKLRRVLQPLGKLKGLKRTLIRMRRLRSKARVKKPTRLNLNGRPLLKKTVSTRKPNKVALFRKRWPVRRRFKKRVRSRSRLFFKKVWGVARKFNLKFSSYNTGDARFFKKFLPFSGPKLLLSLKSSSKIMYRKISSNVMKLCNSAFYLKTARNSALIRRKILKKQSVRRLLRLKLFKKLTFNSRRYGLKMASQTRNRLARPSYGGVAFRRFTLSQGVLPDNELMQGFNSYILNVAPAKPTMGYPIHQFFLSLYSSTFVVYKSCWVTPPINPRGTELDLPKMRLDLLLFPKNPQNTYESTTRTLSTRSPNLLPTKGKGPRSWVFVPMIRYGESAFFRKQKMSLRQMKQKIKLKLLNLDIVNKGQGGYKSILNPIQKAVTDAPFSRIVSDGAIFADTEFGNLIQRVHKLASSEILNSNPFTALYLKPFLFFFKKNLKPTYTRRFDVKFRDMVSTHVNFPLLKQSLEITNTVTSLLWRIKILKKKGVGPQNTKPLTKSPPKVKTLSLKDQPTKSLLQSRSRKLKRVVAKIPNRLRKTFFRYTKKRFFRWRFFVMSSRRRIVKLKRLTKKKVFKDRRYFKWSVSVKKNRRFFNRLGAKVHRNLFRKYRLKRFFGDRDTLEFKPLIAHTQLTKFVRHNPGDSSKSIPSKYLPVMQGQYNPYTYSGSLKPGLGTTLLSIWRIDVVVLFFKNPVLFKSWFALSTTSKNALHLFLGKVALFDKAVSSKYGVEGSGLEYSNLVPHNSFSFSFSRKILSVLSSKVMSSRVSPWYYHNIIRFIEDATGRKALFQFYPFMSQEVETPDAIRYRMWLPRMRYYERRLGHRFFLEESLHILHLSFVLKDATLLCSWLRSLILRISFWKTRFIFRFIRYLFLHYFRFIFPQLDVKGLKIKLKGKISVAGNSRKRTILYRSGETSHSNLTLRVVSDFQTISTFTGVMGLQVWVFY